MSATPPSNEQTVAQQQVVATKKLASELRLAAEEHKNLGSIKGSDELIKKLDELMIEIEEQSDKIVTTILSSKTVFSNLRSLHSTMEDVQNFFSTIAKKSIFTSKSKLQLKMQNHYQTLRSKTTQLMTSVSLELLTHKPVAEPPARTYSELYTAGLNYYYGLAGKPKNYTRAFEKFVQAAEIGDSDSMVMVSRCYFNNQGVEEDYEAGLEWLVKAINIGESNNAKNDLAMKIVERIKESNPNALRDYFSGGDNASGADTPATERGSTKQAKVKFQNASPPASPQRQSQAKAKAQRQQSQNSEFDEGDDDEFGVGGGNGNGNGGGESEEEDEFMLSSKHYRAGQQSDNQPQQSQPQQGVMRRFSTNSVNDFDDAKSGTTTQSFLEQQQQEAEENVFDLEYAFKLLIEAATEEPSVETAKTNLGMFFEECGDIEQALKWYSLASNGGCSRATCRLGALFFNSHSVDRKNVVSDRHKSFSMFKMAAMNGEIDAFNGLGQCYESGVGCDPDIHQSLQYYLKGAEAGDKQAMYNYGYIRIKNALDVIESMKKVKLHSKAYLFSHQYRKHNHHKQKHGRSNNSGNHCNNHSRDNSVSHQGSGGEEEENENENENEDESVYLDMGQKADAALQEGLHWLRAAAENGVADASFQIGRLYEQALGVPQDSAAAQSNYQNAALKGHAKAALFAANLQFEQVKRGDSNDIVCAMDLYKQAAEAGLGEAMNSLAILIEDGARHRMTGTNYDKSEYAYTCDIHVAATWYYEACRKGLSGAFLNFALLLASEPIHSFSDLSGKIITLAEAKHFLEHQMASDILTDRDKRENMMHLLDGIKPTDMSQVMNRSNSHSHSHNNRNHHRNASPGASREFKSGGGHHNSGRNNGQGHRYDQPVRQSYDSTNDRQSLRRSGGELSSLVLKTMAINSQRPLPLSPPKLSNKPSSGGSVTGSVTSVKSTQSRTSIGHKQLLQLQQRSPSTNKNTTNSFNSNNNPSTSNKLKTIVDTKMIHSLNRGPPSGRSSPALHPNVSQSLDMSTTSFQSLKSSAASPHTHTHGHGGGGGGGGGGGSSPLKRANSSSAVPAHKHGAVGVATAAAVAANHRAGELYMTNGPIPPPNYVPKAAPPSQPVGDSKPESRGSSQKQQAGSVDSISSPSVPQVNAAASVSNKHPGQDNQRSPPPSPQRQQQNNTSFGHDSNNISNDSRLHINPPHSFSREFSGSSFDSSSGPPSPVTLVPTGSGPTIIGGHQQQRSQSDRGPSPGIAAESTPMSSMWRSIPFGLGKKASKNKPHTPGGVPLDTASVVSTDTVDA